MPSKEQESTIAADTIDGNTINDEDGIGDAIDKVADVHICKIENDDTSSDNGYDVDERGDNFDQPNEYDEHGRDDVIDRKTAETIGGKVVIPSGMKEIHFNFFEGNQNLTSVIIPGTVKTIAARAFAECANLEEVTLEEGIEEIESCAFIDCPKLRRVTYPDSVKLYRGDAFRETNLDEPVYNASKTVLVFCPEKAAGESFIVPDTVKIIANHGFMELKNLKSVRLPEGLKQISSIAFDECGIREIIIPQSVEQIDKWAFWHCHHLESALILNPKTKVGSAAFYGCNFLKDITFGDLNEYDKICHLKGEPFFIQNLSDAANFDHAQSSEFRRLAELCGKGDADAMNDMSEFFERQSKKTSASPFYERAANYWRYRAYERGNNVAEKWFCRFFEEHPGERLESPLFENSDHRQGMYNFAYPGKMLNDLGFFFFDADKDYEIHQASEEKIVEVAAFADYEGPDEDGFGAEYYYYWWILDDNMQEIPGIKMFYGELRDTDGEVYQERRKKAIEICERRTAYAI